MTKPCVHLLGVAFDQNDLGVQMGSIKLMEKGQPLAFDKAAANKYLKVCTAKNRHATHPQDPASAFTVGLTPTLLMHWHDTFAVLCMTASTPSSTQSFGVFPRWHCINLLRQLAAVPDSFATPNIWLSLCPVPPPAIPGHVRRARHCQDFCDRGQRPRDRHGLGLRPQL